MENYKNTLTESLKFYLKNKGFDYKVIGSELNVSNLLKQVPELYNEELFFFVHGELMGKNTFETKRISPLLICNNKANRLMVEFNSDYNEFNFKLGINGKTNKPFPAIYDKFFYQPFGSKGELFTYSTIELNYFLEYKEYIFKLFPKDECWLDI